MCLILASPSSSLHGIALNKLGFPPLASFVSWPSAFFLLARHSPEQARSPPSSFVRQLAFGLLPPCKA